MNPSKHKWLLLAGQIGMTPGLMSLYGTVPEQFDQILTNFSKCLIEMIGPSSLTDAQKANVIQHSCLKAILYISKTTVLTEELEAKVRTAFTGMPYLIVRVNTLPKNAPVELEMFATVNKQVYKVESSPSSISVHDSSRKLAY